jgi:parallel beta-helix repeat protein
MVYNHYYGVMKERISKLALLTIALLFAFTAATAVFSPTSAVEDGCLNTGIGLSANYINEAPDGLLVVTCDIGVFIDEDINLHGVEIEATTEEAKSVRFGVYVYGVKADIKNSSIYAEENYPHQFIAATYRNAATGNFVDNEVTGFHRAGLVLRGVGTDVNVRGNLIDGVGPKNTGWAENGIQVDGGATASITRNTIKNHWWSPQRWASTGIIVFSDGVTITNNTLDNNEHSIYISGENNRVNGNDVATGVVDESNAWGILVDGNKNHIAGNKLLSNEGLVGVYFFDSSEGNRLTGNRISGFQYPQFDAAGDNIVRGLVTPIE